MKNNIKIKTGFITEEEIEELVDAKESINGGNPVSTWDIATVVTAVSSALQGACPTSSCTKHCINHK